MTGGNGPSSGEDGAILVFDSGVGGLSIVNSVRQMRPWQKFVYLADNACFPYGDLSDARIVERVLSLVCAAVARYRPGLIIIGCNTASTLSLPALRQSLPTIPVVGVVPAVKPAATLTANGRVGVLATPATVRGPYLDRLVREYAADVEVLRVGSSALVREAEQMLRGIPVDLGVVRTALAPLEAADVDTVVLGCTHFPLIVDSLRQTLSGVTHWVDSGAAIGRRVNQLLSGGPKAAPDSLCQTPDIELLFTADAPSQLSSYLGSCSFLRPLCTEAAGDLLFPAAVRRASRPG